MKITLDLFTFTLINLFFISLGKMYGIQCDLYYYIHVMLFTKDKSLNLKRGTISLTKVIVLLKFADLKLSGRKTAFDVFDSYLTVVQNIGLHILDFVFFCFTIRCSVT